MASHATYDDVNLMLRLYDMRREEKMRAARNWFVANFKPKSMTEFNHLCPPGSEQNAMARQVSSYWDMVSSFISRRRLKPGSLLSKQSRIAGGMGPPAAHRRRGPRRF